MHRHHAFDSPEKYAKRWNDPARDTYQKPNEIIQALDLTLKSNVCDLGAGTGYLTQRLSEAVPQGRVIAADVEPAMLDWIAKLADTNDLDNVHTLRATFTSSNLPKGSVDRIVTLNTWHHVEDRVAYARNLSAAFRKGGSFLIVDFLAEETEGMGPPLKMRLSQDQVIQELQKAGYTARVLPETMPRHYMILASPAEPAP